MPALGSASSGACLRTAETEYTVYVQAYNGVAWGPTSPKIAICTLGDDGGAIITGVRTREERDADLLKHAIDVDDLDQNQTGGAGGRIVSRLPKAKRAKRET